MSRPSAPAGHRYLVFFEAPVSKAEIERALRKIEVGILIHCGGITPFVSLAEMRRLGIALTILPSLGFAAAAMAAYDAGRLVQEPGA